MRKKLTIVAFGFTLLFAACPDEQAEQKQSQANDVSHPSMTKNDTSLQQENQEFLHQKQRVEWGDISNWALVLIGGITALAVWKQARDTRLAAEATEKSARASLSQTDCIIASERAWIVIDVKRQDSIVSFRAVNVGKTPAEVLSVHGNTISIAQGNSAPVICWDELDESLICTPPCFLPPTISCPAFEIDLEKLFGTPEDAHYSLKMGMHEFVFYGKVRYFDTLKPDRKEVHETKWRYWLLPYRPDPPIPDPKHPEDNSHT
jgi:hypothetical protein